MYALRFPGLGRSVLMRVAGKRGALPALAACVAVALALSPVLRPGGLPAPALVAVGSAPHLPGHAVALGRLAPDGAGTLRLDVVLAPAGGSKLSAFATAVSTPGSPSFRQFLTPAQFAARFGASDGTLAAVRQSLRERGLHVTGVSPNRLIVHVTGRTRRIERAFGVSLLRYRLPDGRAVYANTSAPRLPRDVAAHVSQIVGLDSLAAPARADIVRAPEVAPRAHATRVSAIAGAGPQPTATCAQQIATASENYPHALISNTDLAQAYGFSDLYQAGNLGQGATVALVEFSSFIPGDIATFGSCYGITPHVNEIAVDGGPGGPVTFGPGVSDQVEAELDIEAVLGLAPNATIDVFEAPQSSDNSSLDDFSAAVDNPDVQVISTSWGRCEGNSGEELTDAEATLFQQAATEGKTIVAAAGDNGSEDCNGQSFGVQRTALAVDDPSSQPFVTGVGGTTFTTLGPPATAVVWNTPTGAGGGGVSSVHAMPSFQSGAPAALGVVNQFSSCGNTSANCREVPDVAADAGTAVCDLLHGGRPGRLRPGRLDRVRRYEPRLADLGRPLRTREHEPRVRVQADRLRQPGALRDRRRRRLRDRVRRRHRGQQRPRLPERPLPGRTGLRPRHRARDADRGRRHRHRRRPRRPALRGRRPRPGDDGDRDHARRRSAARRHEDHDPRLGPRARQRRSLRRQEGRLVHRPVGRNDRRRRSERHGNGRRHRDDGPRHEPAGRGSAVPVPRRPDGRAG